MLCRHTRRLGARVQVGRMGKVQGVAAIVVSLSVVPGVTAAKAEPIAAGPGQQIVGLGRHQIPIFTYRPTGCADPSLLLVFHGAERNAQDYRDYARALADRSCMLVAAPLFAQHIFPSWRYQRGGIVDKNGRPRDPSKWTGQRVL